MSSSPGLNRKVDADGPNRWSLSVNRLIPEFSNDGVVVGDGADRLTVVDLNTFQSPERSPAGEHVVQLPIDGSRNVVPV